MNLKKLCPAFLVPVLQRLMALPDLLRFCYYKKTAPYQPNHVLLYCPSRDRLSGNSQYIAEALQKTDLTVSVVTEHDGTPDQLLLKLLATCGYVVVDDYARRIYPLPFPAATRVIQLWHATGAFKRVGFSRGGNPGNDAKTSLTHRNYTDVCVSSADIVPAYSEAFGIPEHCVHPLGVPRTDLFFDPVAQQEQTQALLRQYPQLQGKKLVLFAPTFRGENRGDAHYPPSFLDVGALLQQLPEDYVLGIKLHPFVQNTLAVPPAVAHRVVDLSEQREINPLLFLTDTLITDYSSVIFEYAFLKKPVIFYVPDLAVYDRDRSFYFPFSQYIYGQKVTQQADLPAAILHPVENAALRERFYRKFLGSCDGHSTERIVNTLFGGQTL